MDGEAEGASEDTLSLESDSSLRKSAGSRGSRASGSGAPRLW